MSGKVLVVDDSALSRRTMRRILETAGYSVVEADEGMTALEMYFIEKPVAVLLDLVMKGMYGLDVLTKLREMDRNARVVIASADIQSSTRILAEEAGACAVVNKPLVASEVIEALEKALAGGPILDTH
jgi:two-component system chemotaxis response regulator CheY